ncbi:hypothetical protein D9756_001518 [Leucocoprinus leucothites]|uniref:Uncharacterized protein n=1 Tax=Leucocoprinus leucothites TaxID=201217 RepID=A0A8H5G456_9AGAR|nr:hypothetical protein D9756_001518 [Leucoagaricus leucothites]
MSTYNENPFASSHSLDTNPFDDPPQPQTSHSTRLEDLQRREADIERREAELNQKAEHIRKHGRNNWPFFYPLIFHSIQDEIPEASRPLITRLYQLWLVLFGTLIVNMVACLFILFSGAQGGGSDLGASIGTGSAGLMQTIRMFTARHWAAAILSTIATVGWTLQGVGNAFYFLQASSIIYKHHNAAGHTMEKVSVIAAASGEPKQN